MHFIAVFSVTCELHLTWWRSCFANFLRSRLLNDVTLLLFKVRSCLESFIDLGYDLSLFESEELEIICQKQGYLVTFFTQCPPFNGITLGYHNSDSNNRVIQLAHVYYCLDIMEPLISDYNKRLNLVSVIQLSGRICITLGYPFMMSL